jgi:hypothetical protein
MQGVRLELSTDIATRSDLAANTAYVTDGIGYLLGIYKPWIFYNV